MKSWLFIASACAALAQTPLEFEVSSVKAAAPFEGRGSIGSMTDGLQFTAEHESLLGLIEFAYQLQEFQISGGPSWASGGDLAGANRFEIRAKAPGDTPPTREQVRQMVKALLAERFQLKFHMETRDLPAYALTVDPKGHKMKLGVRQEGVSTALWSGRSNESRYEAHAIPMSELTFVLRSAAERPVVDRTGLEGTYAFDLRWARNGAPPEATSAPSIFTAVQEQLGLKLESVKTPFETMVIDSVQRPSEN